MTIAVSTNTTSDWCCNSPPHVLSPSPFTPLSFLSLLPPPPNHVQWAKKYNMVIVSPILERDSAHGDILANTAGETSVCAGSALCMS